MKKLICGILLCLLPTYGGWAEESQTVITQVLSKTTASWDGEALPCYPAGTPEITILRIEIPAGAVLPRHKHPVINAGVLIRGKITVVTDDNAQLSLEAGDAIIEVVDTWHYGKNEGSETAVIIVFYAGTVDTPITIK